MPGGSGTFLSIPRNMPARMNLLLDAPDQEFWLDESNRGTTIVPAFANAYIWALYESPSGIQRTVHSEPRQSVRERQFSPVGNSAPHAAGRDVRSQSQHRRDSASESAAGVCTTAWTNCSGARNG